MDKQFIQVGNLVFAVKHIAAINLNVKSANGIQFVSVRVAGAPEPWTFPHGTPHANAISEWAQSALHTQRLLAPKSPSSQSE